MKKKILSLLAAFFMLFGTSAMAQVDSTLEGDVNGDGVVDIADITAVIAIIKQNAEANPTYYWYVGKVNPAEMSSINVNDGWTECTSQKQTPITISKQNADYSTNIWYIAAPYNWGYTLFNATGAASAEAGYNITEVTLNGVRYKVWASKSAGYQAVGQLIIK